MGNLTKNLQRIGESFLKLDTRVLEGKATRIVLTDPIDLLPPCSQEGIMTLLFPSRKYVKSFGLKTGGDEYECVRHDGRPFYSGQSTLFDGDIEKGDELKLIACKLSGEKLGIFAMVNKRLGRKIESSGGGYIGHCFFEDSPCQEKL